MHREMCLNKSPRNLCRKVQSVQTIQTSILCCMVQFYLKKCAHILEIHVVLTTLSNVLSPRKSCPAASKCMLYRQVQYSLLEICSCCMDFLPWETCPSILSSTSLNLLKFSQGFLLLSLNLSCSLFSPKTLSLECKQ